jgi:hypothetical protein
MSFLFESRFQSNLGNETEPAGPANGRGEESKKRMAFHSFSKDVRRRSGRFSLVTAVRPVAVFDLVGHGHQPPK